MELTNVLDTQFYFHTYLLSFYYMLGPVLDSGESVVNKTDKNCCCYGSDILMGEDRK